MYANIRTYESHHCLVLHYFFRLTQIKRIMLLFPHSFEDIVDFKFFLCRICYQFRQCLRVWGSFPVRATRVSASCIWKITFFLICWKIIMGQKICLSVSSCTKKSHYLAIGQDFMYSEAYSYFKTEN